MGSWWSKGYYGGYWSSSSLSGLGDFENDAEEIEETTSSWRDIFKSRYKSSLGFSSDRLSSSISGSYSYPRYYRSSGEVERQKELLSRAYRTARDLVVILDFPFKITFQLSKEGAEMEYGWKHRLFIPTGPLDETEYTEDERINLCSSGAIQQAAYLKYTEYRVVLSFTKRLNETLSFNGEKVEGKGHEQFVISLFNLIELERVENNLLQERPGYLNFIDTYKTYLYRKFVKTRLSSSGEVQAFLGNLYRLIRYPEELQTEVLEKYSDTYKRIQKLLTPLPESTKDSCKVAFSIYLEIMKTFKNDLKLDVKGGSVSRIMKDLAIAYNSGITKCIYGFDMDSGEALGSEHIYSAIREGEKSWCDGSSILSKLVTGIAEKSENNTYFEYARGDQDTYLNIARRVSQYVPAIKKLIKNTDQNYDFNIYGSKCGKLDSNNKLIEAYQGDPNVYVRQGHVRTNKTCVCILIDESGSMWGNDKWEMARDAAILLNEALKGMPGVELNIFGHTGDTISERSTEIKVYCQDGMKLDPYSLSSVTARNENRDGTAIYQSALRIRKKSKTPGIMIVLSDGEPCACGYHGKCAIEDVRKNVKKTEELGFTVIQVSIDTVNAAKEMFTNCIDLKKDLRDLPVLLGKIVKKAIVENKKTTVS